MPNPSPTPDPTHAIELILKDYQQAVHCQYCAKGKERARDQYFIACGLARALKTLGVGEEVLKQTAIDAMQLPDLPVDSWKECTSHA